MQSYGWKPQRLQHSRNENVHLCPFYLFSLGVVRRGAPHMQQVRVPRTLVLLMAAPAGLATCEDDQSAAKHREEMTRLFAMNHADLQTRDHNHFNT